MNSLGLCLFLAAAREFNTATRFIVLDDVVNSFDADHRCQLAELLVNEFQDFQILAFTHDPIWYEHLRRLGARWKAFTLGPWTYGLGVDILPPPAEALARVRAFIDRGEVDAAGNLARQLAEQRLKRLLSSLRAPVPYREGYDNDRRDLEELFRALRRHAKSSGRFSHRDSDAWDEFAASRFLANLASHDQPAMPAGLSGSDIEFFVTKLTELEALFRCEHCAKPVWQLRAEPNDDQSQCECGQLKI
jgi:hypothetical protein